MTRRSSNNRSKTPEATPAEDVVLMCGASSDGRGVDVVRKRGESLQAGVVRPLEEGKPLQGEVVQLVQRGESPLFDVTVRFDPQAAKAKPDAATPALPETAGTRGHPARVATDDYRKNWDAIWKRPAGKQLLN